MERTFRWGKTDTYFTYTLASQRIAQCFIFIYLFINEFIFCNAFSVQFGVYKFLYTITGGVILLLVGNLCKKKIIGYMIQAILCSVASFLYITQHLYYKIFSTPYVLASLSGLRNALEFKDVGIEAFLQYWYCFLGYIFIFLLFLTLYRHVYFHSGFNPVSKYVLIPMTLVSITVSIFAPLYYTQGVGSERYLLLNEYVPLNCVYSFGVPTNTILDLRYTFFEEVAYEIAPNQNIEEVEQETLIEYDPQIMNIEFDLEEGNSDYLEMNTFFSNREYTYENEYTGMFEGKNLILITGEAFSDKIIDPVLTPTLYKMQTEGFYFENFYTPLWGVSTSDGEFVATTGLLPKSGVWSYTEIADNSMPFAFGNQFNELGYSSYAFHNHTYTYYNRQLSYPTMGYDYYGNGNGLTITQTWPESDLEMVEEATPMFVNDEHFHVYMLSVSGHLQYNFYGNTMAMKHQEEVADLEYSEAVKAYLACNLELEYALQSLIEQLDQAGQLENTVIALSGDHYPYGLEPEEYAELYGKDSIDETFEIYENTFLLWNCEMEESVQVDKYCSSLDIAATLSNLFDLEYDSRLYIGQDMLSTAPGLVMFLDRSYITDDYMYNGITQEITYHSDQEVSQEIIELNNQKVAQLFRYSAMIIEDDYYAYLFD